MSPDIAANVLLELCRASVKRDPAGDVWLQSGSLATLVRVAAAGGAASRSAKAADGPRVVAAMPGLVSAVEVVEGQPFEQGQACVVMEVMKVVLRLPAPVAGRVARVLCVPGETVAGGAVLVEIEAA